MGSFEKLVENRGFRMTWQNPENTSTAIIDEDNLEVFRRVFVPQSIAVVKKTNVSRYQNGGFFIGHSRAYCRGSTAVDAAGASIAKNFDRRIDINQLCISNGRTVAYLQHGIFWQGRNYFFESLEIRKRNLG